jgi:hypothetical protein
MYLKFINLLVCSNIVIKLYFDVLITCYLESIIQSAM